jgi:hypothetical protein
MKELRKSRKLNIYQRRILINKVSYTIKPSCVMPSMTGLTDEVEKGCIFVSLMYRLKH